MKKTTLQLLIIGILTMPLMAKAQSMNSPIDSNFKIKKGDHFTIEFTNQLEDYSNPVESIDYCAPSDLRQLILRCEVTEASNDNIQFDFNFERIFHLKETGEYGDSYFGLPNGQHIAMSSQFELLVDVNLQTNNIVIDNSQEKTDLHYGTYFQSVDIGNSSVRTELSDNTIQFSEIEALISKFLDDWKATNFKAPLPSFGHVEVDDFKRYRILDATIPVKRNTILHVSTTELNKEEEIRIVIKDTSFDPFGEVNSLLFNGKTHNGRIDFEYYLEKQKRLTLIYRDQEISFIATPGKKLEIELQKHNNYYYPQYSSNNSGDNEYTGQLKQSFTFEKFKNELYKINTLNDLQKYFDNDINQKLTELNSFKNEMTAVWYKKKLMDIYYWTAAYIIDWHTQKNINLDYSKLRKFTSFKNIHPLYDYYLDLDDHQFYLKQYKTHKDNYNSLSSIETNQGFDKGYSFSDSYNIQDIILWGYPKYYLLKELLVSSLELNGIEYVGGKYMEFITNCNYPPFVQEVKRAFNKYEKIEPGKSILDLNIFFTKDECYEPKNERYKLIKYAHNGVSQQQVNEFEENIKKINDELDFENGVEIYIIYSKQYTDSTFQKIIKNNKNPFVKFIGYTTKEYYHDTGILDTYFTPLLILLSPENKIIHRAVFPDSTSAYIKNYISAQNQPTSKAGNSRLLWVIVASLILSGIISWFVIRIRTQQIRKRESARRKVSELELTAIRSQMNPHFIFNAMGSIQNLINQNKVKNANLYLSNFARLMRMVLANSNKKLVSMSHELELIETYLKLEQLRVDFTFTISVAENIDPEVEELPGMLIQPFVENAVIHGITPKGEGNIDVTFAKKDDTLICEIIDNGVGFDTEKIANGNGIAIKLSEKRLDLLNSQLQDKLKLVVENRQKTVKTSGTKITLYIPAG